MDDDKKHGVDRCEICGQRPDRPKDGHRMKLACPTCGKSCPAYYFDENGVDSISIKCSDCGGDDIVSYGAAKEYTRERFLQDRNTAQAIATGVWNECKGVDRLECISVTVGHYTATVEA